MSGLSLKNPFSAVNNAFMKASYYFGCFLYDHHFLDIHMKATAHATTHKAAAIATRAKRAFQRSAMRALSQKTSSGDFTPKPIGNVFFSIAQEGVYLLGKLAPHVPRLTSSPVAISLTVAACTSLLLLDDTTRNMAMDQFSQMMAIFQNDVNEANNDLPQSKNRPVAKVG